MKPKVVLAVFLLCLSLTLSAAAEKPKVLGKERIVAFFYLPRGINPETLKSANLIHGYPGMWKHWAEKGVVSCVGKTWFDLLRNPVEKAVEILTKIDYGRNNPQPVVCIDEFGFDFGGQTDRKAAEILRETKKKMPELHIVVWHMRGPVAPVLARAYSDFVDLVLPEAYVGNVDDYWQIITQVRAAQLEGLIHKTVIALGLGMGGNAGEKWAVTKKELEQQARFLRLVAPDSPGITFYSAGATLGETGLIEYADELGGRFGNISPDGAGLPKKAMDLYRTFFTPQERPLIVTSGFWAEPDRSSEDPGRLVQPKTMRVLLMNLGDEAAADVKVRLRNPKDKGGDVFAEGKTDIPGKSVAIAVLPVSGKWNVWKTWDVEVEAGGNEVLIYPQ